MHSPFGFELLVSYPWVFPLYVSTNSKGINLFLKGMRLRRPPSPITAADPSVKDLNNAFTFLESCPFHLFVQLSDPSFCFLLAKPDIFVSLSHYLRSIFLAPWLFIFPLSDLSISPCRGVQYSRCRCIRAIKSMITVFLHQVWYCCNYCLSTHNFSLCHTW